MTTCTNCFSGCVETTSDKCVKYTGNDITFLNIHTGDSLESIEEHITDYIATVFSGIGIMPVIESTLICTTVKQFLPCDDCGAPTLVDILTAIIEAICSLETQIVANTASINTIEATYDVSCFSGTPIVGTHAVLQAAITTLCAAIGNITTLQNLFATCITTSNINTYIQNYINAQSNVNMYTKMVPYVIYPFYPSTTIMSGAFDINGIGLGTWQNIYLCNGYGGFTPDLRGRSLIGTTDMGGGPFNPNVDPGSGNPTYNLGTLNGQNSVTLSSPQIPAHTHTTNVVVTDPTGLAEIPFGGGEIFTTMSGGQFAITEINGVGSSVAPEQKSTTVPVTMTDLSVSVSINPNSPAGSAHTNVHPVLGVYYIMFIPS
jgi:microcystin-dependent protein